MEISKPILQLIETILIKLLLKFTTLRVWLASFLVRRAVKIVIRPAIEELIRQYLIEMIFYLDFRFA